MDIKVRKKNINDVLVFLQKEFGLYFVEFRQSQKGNPCIVLTKSLDNSDKSDYWWIHITINKFSADVLVVVTGNIEKKVVEKALVNQIYMGYGKSNLFSWLPL